MKWVFFTLFLVNWGYFFIGFLSSAPARGPIAATEEGIETFKLRSELARVKIESPKEPKKNEEEKVASADEAVAEQSASPVVATASVETTHIKSAPSVSDAETVLPENKDPEVLKQQSTKIDQPLALGCFRYGPFFRAQDYDPVLTVLQKAGVPVNTAEEDGPVPNKFWVFMPGKDTYEETKKEQAKLTELGVLDIYILRTEPYVNRISLGVYNDRAMADRRLRDLEKVNVNAQLELQYKPGKRFWLEYQAENDAAAEQLVRQFSSRFPAAEPNSMPCRK